MIKSYKLRRRVTNGVIYVLLTLLAVLWILPLAWLIMMSFSGEGRVFMDHVIPNAWTVENYVKLFTETSGAVNYLQWFINTLIVSVCSCVISTISVLMVSYAFSRLRFKSRKKFINIGFILGMFPGFLTMVAIYYLLDVMNLTHNIAGLVVVYAAGAGLGFAISKGFFDTIPRALDEAATIDGATRNQIFWKIIVPMSKPIVVYTILTTFTSPWTDFIFAKLLLGDAVKHYTVAVGLWSMVSKPDYVDRYFLQFCAGAVIVAIPITALFLKMQKYYVEGVTGGAVKG